jgi:hypothetical protein
MLYDTLIQVIGASGMVNWKQVFGIRNQVQIEIGES